MEEKRMLCSLCNKLSAWEAVGLAVPKGGLHFCQRHYNLIVLLYQRLFRVRMYQEKEQ